LKRKNCQNTGGNKSHPKWHGLPAESHDLRPVKIAGVNQNIYFVAYFMFIANAVAYSLVLFVFELVFELVFQYITTELVLICLIARALNKLQ